MPRIRKTRRARPATTPPTMAPVGDGGVSTGLEVVGDGGAVVTELLLVVLLELEIIALIPAGYSCQARDLP